MKLKFLRPWLVPAIRQLLLLCICFWMSNNLAVMAQKRPEDIIYTRSGDTLTVKITEVGLRVIKFMSLKNDMITNETIARDEIIKIAFGNGDVEQFDTQAVIQSHVPEKKYYRIVPKTAFQKEIATWSDVQLLAAKSKYKSGGIAALVGGPVITQVGAILMIAGLVNIAFDDSDRGSPMFVGGGLMIGGGISLTIFGGKNVRKYKFVKTEMNIRGLQAVPAAPFK